MSLRAAMSSDLLMIHNYLSVNEWRHTMLSSRFLNQGIMTIPDNSLVYLSEKKNQLCGVFLSDTRGYVLLSHLNDMDVRDDLEEFCKLANKFHAPYCIAGTPNLLEVTEGIFKKNIRSKTQYHLMIHESASSNFTQKNLLFYIENSTVNHHKMLLPLELKYQQEEVFDRKLTLEDEMALGLLYMEKLKKDMAVHAVEKTKGVVVAKAEVSHMGFHYGQLGGVYTLPDFRNRGLAQDVIKRLLERLHRDKKELSLFVKKSNLAAVTLYHNLGLKNVGEFAIHYVR